MKWHKIAQESAGEEAASCDSRAGERGSGCVGFFKEKRCKKMEIIWDFLYRIGGFCLLLFHEPHFVGAIAFTLALACVVSIVSAIVKSGDVSK